MHECNQVHTKTGLLLGDLSTEIVKKECDTKSELNLKNYRHLMKHLDVMYLFLLTHCYLECIHFFENNSLIKSNWLSQQERHLPVKYFSKHCLAIKMFLQESDNVCVPVVNALRLWECSFFCISLLSQAWEGSSSNMWYSSILLLLLFLP